MLPVTGSMVKVPWSGAFNTFTDVESNTLPIVPGLSLLKVAKVTGLLINVVAISVFATGLLATVGSKTVMVSVSVLQPVV